MYFVSARNEISIVENQELKNISSVSKLVIKSFDTTVVDVLFLSEITSDYITGNVSQAKFLSTISPFLRSKDYYRKLIICDTEGNTILKVFIENREIIIKQDRINYRKNIDFMHNCALTRGHVYISEFTLDDGFPVLVFGNLVFDRFGRNKAVLLLMYNYKPIFDIFRTTFEEYTAEKKKIARYFITNSDGYWIKGPKPEDEFSFLFKSVPRKRFLHLYPEAGEKSRQSRQARFL